MKNVLEPCKLHGYRNGMKSKNPLPGLDEGLWHYASVDVFESAEAAASWFRTPAVALFGRTPFEVAVSPDGRREVEALLRRIDYGLPL